MFKSIINKLKARRKYFKNIKNGTDIPVLWTTINITKPNTNKNCATQFHPNILNQLSEEDMNYVKECLGLAIEKIRDNVDFKK